MRTPIYEQETTINLYRGDKSVRIYTSDYTMMHKLDKLCAANPDDWRCVRVNYCDGDIVSKDYSAPTGFITFRKKRRTLSDKDKGRLAENLSAQGDDA